MTNLYWTFQDKYLYTKVHEGKAVPVGEVEVLLYSFLTVAVGADECPGNLSTSKQPSVATD
jgi:hypothetical protein